MENNTKLKKNLGVTAAMSLVVGCVIGAGVFFKPFAIYGATGGAPGMGMLAWIFGGLASILGALTFAVVFPLVHSQEPAAAIMGIFLGLFVIFMHRSNIVRLLKGNERKATFSKFRKQK